MIRIFGLRILTGKDIGIINDNYNAIESKIKEIEEKHKLLSEYVTSIDNLLDAIAEERLNSFNKPKKVNKTKK